MIIAVDFDGVLVEDKYPDIGKPDWDMLKVVWQLGFTDHELVLWTSRVGEKLEEAKQWCDKHDLKFASVNANVPSNIHKYGTDPRKVYADIYIDDRAFGYSREKAIKLLSKLFKEEE